MIRRSISTLAFADSNMERICEFAAAAGFNGIEIAPTQFVGLSSLGRPNHFENLRRNAFDRGLVISGVQSLLFGLGDVQILNQRHWETIKKRIEVMAQIGMDLESNVLVFGSPRNRRRDSMDKEDALAQASRFFKYILPVLEKSNQILTLEPNARHYGCDFILNYSDALELSRRIESEFIRVQIDTGNAELECENPLDLVDIHLPHHVHVSAPMLRGLEEASSNLDEFIHKLETSGYHGWVTLEVSSDCGDLAESLRRFGLEITRPDSEPPETK